MTKMKKTKSNQGLAKKAKAFKAPRRAVGGGSVEIPGQVLATWEDLSGIREPAKAARNARNFARLWEIFTTRRDEISPELLQAPEEAEAYLTGFHLPNAARAALLCQRIAQRLGLGSSGSLGQWFDKHFTRQRIFDLGCGSGAWSQVWLATVRLRRNSFYLIDASAPLLGFAAKGLSAIRAGKSGTTSVYIETINNEIHEVDFEVFDSSEHRAQDDGREKKAGKSGEASRSKSLDVYILGYVWNELASDPHACRHVMARFEACAKRGEHAMVLLAEPATDDMAWEAMGLRNELCAAGWVAIYPCPTGAGACPMLDEVDGPRDWCFSEGGWRKPGSYAAIEEKTGIGHSKLNASMFAIVSPALADEMARSAPLLSTFTQVVVGRPAIHRSRGGGFSYLLCTADGLLKSEPKRIDPRYGKPRGSTIESKAAKPSRSGGRG